MSARPGERKLQILQTLAAMLEVLTNEGVGTMIRADDTPRRA